MDGRRERSAQESEVLSADEIDASGIEQIVIHLENGEEETLHPKQGGEFMAYELYDSANYIRNLSRRILKG